MEPFVGWLISKTYGPASEPRTSVAGRPLMMRSLDCTPPTGSLNVTSISLSSVIVAPGAGASVTTIGAIESTSVYCHVAFGASASNGFGEDSRSTIPCTDAQVIPTGPSGGCGKVNV